MSRWTTEVLGYILRRDATCQQLFCRLDFAVRHFGLVPTLATELTGDLRSKYLEGRKRIRKFGNNSKSKTCLKKYRNQGHHIGAGGYPTYGPAYLVGPEEARQAAPAYCLPRPGHMASRTEVVQQVRTQKPALVRFARRALHSAPSRALTIRPNFCGNPTGTGGNSSFASDALSYQSRQLAKFQG